MKAFAVFVAAPLVALAVAPQPAAARSAVYGGSSIRNPITIVATGPAQKVTHLVASVDIACPSGRELPFHGSFTARARLGPGLGSSDMEVTRNARGRFEGRTLEMIDASATEEFTVRIAVKATLARTRARGTVRGVVDVRVAEPEGTAPGALVETCTTGAMPFAAMRAPGRVYAGETSQQEPFVMLLGKRRTRVDELIFEWTSATCTPPGWLHIEDDLFDFRIRGGAFGDVFEQRFAREDGGSLVYGYDIRGRVVTRSSARGTIRVSAVNTVPGVEPTVCNTGRLTWTAASG